MCNNDEEKAKKKRRTKECKSYYYSANYISLTYVVILRIFTT